MPLKLHNTTFKDRLVKVYDTFSWETNDALYYDGTNGYWQHIYHDLVHDQDGDFLLDQNGERLYA